MVLVPTDLKIVKSQFKGGDIGSLGGPMTDAVVQESSTGLWDMITDAELSSSVVGEYEVRCVYARNFSPNNETLKNTQIWISQNTASPFTDIDIGIGTAPMGEEEQTVPDENTLPQNIFWTFARGEENAQLIGDIDPGKGKSFWIRRHAGPARSGSSYAADNYILRFKFLRSAPTSEPGPGPSGNDRFGVRMIYPTNEFEDASKPFYINMDNPLNDCRFSYQGDSSITKNADGSWNTGPSARLRCWIDVPGCAREVLWEASKTAVMDHDLWGDRQWMYADHDWRNMEITAYWKIAKPATSTDQDLKIYMYGRTWRHNNSLSCLGSAYKGVVYGDGVLKFHKESFHGGGQPCNDRSIETIQGVNIGRNDNNKWFGVKVMMWNYLVGTIKKAHLELWIDRDANNTWKKMGEKNDTGGWYPGAPDANCPGDEFCGGHQDQIILWGGPLVELRVDDYVSTHFKWVSVREIIPPTTTSGEGGQGGGGPEPEPGEPETPCPPLPGI